MAPGDYDAFLAREVDAFMGDDSDDDQADEQDFYGDEGDDEASDYALMGACP